MRSAKTALVAALVLTAVLAAPRAALAVGPDTRWSHRTVAGLHNTYEKSAYPHLVDALDAGASLVELDIWVFGVGVRWRVSHDLPLVAMSNNCTRGATVNQGFDVCLDNLRAWHDAHPGHRPITVKIEMKNGFNVEQKASAGDFDTLVRGKLGGDRHYLLIMTDGQAVAPPLSGRNPDPAAAARRLADLARAHASIVSTDWYDATGVLPTELDRGQTGVREPATAEWMSSANASIGSPSSVLR